MMMTERVKPWSFGTDVKECKNVEEVLNKANLNYSVVESPIFNAAYQPITGYKSTVRSDNGEVMGIVGDRYTIVQNYDAFAFADEMIDKGLVFENAGQHKSRVWIQAKMPDTSILGDTYSPYITFTNSHDGTSSVKLFFTPLRIFCSNCVNMATKEASRSFSFNHSINVYDKLVSAENAIVYLNNYMEALKNSSEAFANMKVTADQLDMILDNLFKANLANSERKLNNVKELKSDFYECLNQPDIVDYKNTAYGAIMAATDFVDHRAAKRETSEFAANRWNVLMTGSPFVDNLTASLTKVA